MWKILSSNDVEVIGKRSIACTFTCNGLLLQPG